MTTDKKREDNLPPDLADTDIAVGDVLRDRRFNQYFKITTIDEHGIGLRDADTEFYVPHSWFVTKHGHRLHPIDNADSIDPPDWI